MLIVIIIPIYNESAVVYNLLQNEIFKNYQLILVNDGSTDEFTVKEIKIPFYFLQHSKNLGQGAALQTGMELAKILKADIVVHFDADGQHNPADIKTLIEPIKQGNADVVLGSRFIKKKRQTKHSQIPSSKKVILQCARVIQFLYTGIILTDSQNGLRAISGKFLNEINITENRMTHAIELIEIFKRKKMLIAEVPVNITYSSYSSKKGQKLFNGFVISGRLLLSKIGIHKHFTSLLSSVTAGILFLFFINGNLLLMIVSMLGFYLLILFLLVVIKRRKDQIILQTKMIRNQAIQNCTKLNYPE